MKRLKSKVIGCVVLPALLLLAGCASKVPEKDKYGNYFTPMKTSPGERRRRVSRCCTGGRPGWI
ncbi:hypothetical protein N4G58_08225 [Edwardsiella piscicida]|nr:hypothetical protein N4G58_08225 [Edwardsiella piscicida]